MDFIILKLIRLGSWSLFFRKKKKKKKEKGVVEDSILGRLESFKGHVELDLYTVAQRSNDLGTAFTIRHNRMERNLRATHEC